MFFCFLESGRLAPIRLHSLLTLGRFHKPSDLLLICKMGLDTQDCGIKGLRCKVDNTTLGT